MTGIFLNNIAFQLGCKENDIIFSKIDVAWNIGTSTDIDLDFSLTNTWGIFVIKLEVMGNGSGAPYTIIDRQTNDIIYSDSQNVFQINSGRSFYYFIKGDELHFRASQVGITYGINYLRVTVDTMHEELVKEK